jgi:hypothetical protein
MFPRCLCEGAFSLVSDSSGAGVDDGSSKQQQECCAFSVCASLTEDGALGRIVTITPSTIKVDHRWAARMNGGCGTACDAVHACMLM